MLYLSPWVIMSPLYVLFIYLFCGDMPCADAYSIHIKPIPSALILIWHMYETCHVIGILKKNNKIHRSEKPRELPLGRLGSSDDRRHPVCNNL
jgi:hypothetical protein